MSPKRWMILTLLASSSYGNPTLHNTATALRRAESINDSESGQVAISQLFENPSQHIFPLEDKRPFPMPLCHGQRIEEASIEKLQSYLEEGYLTSVDLCRCYLDRINQVDRYLRSVIQLNPDAIDIAASSDKLRAQGRILSPLHGLPFLAKDNMGTKDKMDTSTGSYALIGGVVPRDAHIISLLRESGAVLLGKSNMDEFAGSRTYLNLSAGYSAIGGQTRNPYNLSLSTSGSSAGAAAAAAANLAAFTLGTDTDASIAGPARRQGLASLRPTIGLTSRAGVVPFSLNQDTIGFFGKHTRDLAFILEGMAGPDPRDNASLLQPSPVPKYSKFLADAGSLNGVSFGLPWASFWQHADEDILSNLLEVITMMESAGAIIINGTEFPLGDRILPPDGIWDAYYGVHRGYANESESTVIFTDLYNDLQTYLSEIENIPYKTLEDIIDFNIRYAGSEGGLPGIHPAFGSGQDAFYDSLATLGLHDETYLQARDFCKYATRSGGIDGALLALNDNSKNNTVGVLLVPDSVATSIGVAAQAGYPYLTFPVSIGKGGIPFGFGLMGTAYSEPALIRWASAIEDLLRQKSSKFGRVPPRFHDWRAPRIPTLYYP